MKSIYILEIMAGVIAAVVILILGSWPWAGIMLVLGIPCAICLTAGIKRHGEPKKVTK